MERESLDMQAVHRWDDTALTMLSRHSYKALAAFSVQIVAQTQVAEEIVQDIFVRTWQRRNTYITEGALRAYLYNSVRNESISYPRRQRT
jgi:RNA polymerase sigma-70 factor (ECF subfamily)